MVLMTDVGWVQLMEKHLVQMTELNSTHVLENPKERRLVCLSAGLMVVQMVQMMESGLVHPMERLLAQLTEIYWDQMTDNLKEICLVSLSADLMVLMTEGCWAHLMESGLEQLMDLKMEKSSACLLAQWMEVQKVPLMDVGWVQLLELYLE